MTTGAIILAAGSSSRMGGVDKLLQPLDRMPLVAHAIFAFLGHPEIDALAVVVSQGNRRDIDQFLDECEPAPEVVYGGPRRRDSVRAGLEALPGCQYVVVHDGARPLVTRELISDVLAAAREAGAALCGVPVSDTLKRAARQGLVEATVDREGLWQAQTPQAFRRDLLLRAHDATDADATDDAALVEALGEPVRIISGSNSNLKVTTPDDLRLARALLASRST